MIVSLDGVGAFDHVYRAAFLQKLHDTPALQALVPLVFALYGTGSRFLWWDDEGAVHDVKQGEGGEQGDPLMPALFALAQHNALEEANGNLAPSEKLMAFLDDLYLWICRDRAAEAFQELASTVRERQSRCANELGQAAHVVGTSRPATTRNQSLRRTSADCWQIRF